MHVNTNPQSISLLTKKKHESDIPFCHQTYAINVQILCSVSCCISMICPFIANGSQSWNTVSCFRCSFDHGLYRSTG